MTAGRIIKLAIYGVGGLVSSLTFSVGIMLQPGAASVFFFIVAVIGATSVRTSFLALLPRLYLLLYALPFSVCLLYLGNPQNTWLASPTGVAILYQSDGELIAGMIAFGTVGLFGLLFGFELAGGTAVSGSSSESSEAAPLPLAISLAFAAFAVGLSWLSAPSATLLEATYASAGTEARSVGMHFAAAYLVSYGLLINLAIDVERERTATIRRRLKVGVLIGAVAYIVVFLQLMRGDRESFGLLVGLCAIYVTSGAARSLPHVAWKRVRHLVTPIVLVLFVYVTMGSVRFLTAASLYQRTVVDIVEDGFEWNTWTSVLLTNLGAAAEYRHKTIHYMQGQTYVDYFLSIPPGFVAAAIGYERPVDVSRGPAWWYEGLSTGGMHPAVVPFKNFGILGPFAVVAAFGWFITRVEVGAHSPGYWRRLTFAMTAAASFFWFWYGDMNMIRTLMVIGVVGVLDRLGRLLGEVVAGREPAHPPGELFGEERRPA